MPSIEELEAALAEARSNSAQANIPTLLPQQERSADKYAPTAWGANEYDFTTPGGQLCRLRNVPLEELAKTGVLDQVTRLPGLTAELVNASEGQPPTAADLPDQDTIVALTKVVNALVPLVVVAPVIHPIPDEGEERVDGLIYVDSVDFADRVAIMNRTVGSLRKLDSFRN